jgi:hypothetical protein
MMRDEGAGMIYFPLLQLCQREILIFSKRRWTRTDCVQFSSRTAVPTVERSAMPRRRPLCFSTGCVTGKGIGCRLSAPSNASATIPPRLYGFEDRGVLAPGLLADLNVIDLESLQLNLPTVAFDLPAGGRRLLQTASGYDCTIKSGRVTFRGGVATGEYPGRVIRGPQPEPESSSPQVTASDSR